MVPRTRTVVRSPLAWACVAWILTSVSVFTGEASGATKWFSLEPQKTPGKVCISAGADQLTYDRLDDESPVEFTVTGPRRVKVLTRYLYSEGDPATAGYTIRVVRDGVMLLRKAVTTGKDGGKSLCGKPESAVGKIRRIYLDVPKGSHTYQLFVVESDRAVGARVFRQVKVRQSATVSLTPLQYTSVYTLQFASGSLSEYYGFDADQPLAFRVVGPTRIKICTRLEFDHTMNGSQSYGVEILEDGQKAGGYQYHVRKMETVSYLEHPDVLPGEKKCFNVRVPKGPHAYELRITNGTKRRGAAKIYIPKSDLKKGQ